MILHDPFCVLTAGFWLSFTAIALLIYGYAYRITSGSFFEKWGRGQLLLVTGMLPVLLFWFQKAPTFASLANLVCVPWVSLITLPLIFIGCLMLLFNETLANYILFMSLNSLDLMWNMLDYISKIQSTSIYTAKPGLVVLILAIIGLLVLHLPAGVPARMSGILLTLPLFFPVKIEKADTTFTMTMLEVGQGLAIVVETRNHVLVYDTGPAYSSSFDAGEDIILPFLRSNQHSKVDLLIQSHGDLDHIGGLVSLMKSIEIDSIVTSVPDEIQHSHVMYCKKGQFWKFDDITIEVLHPPNRNSFKGNNASCVVKISNGYLSVLLTGDIEKTAESSLVISQNKNLSADFLIAPHHGSKTSSTQTFIDTVGPDFVLFPVGHGNRFGFPKSDIVARYSASSVTTLASDQSGAIEIIIKDDQFEIVQHGVSNKRFWHTDI
jgi:competence protein ComEC